MRRLLIFALALLTSHVAGPCKADPGSAAYRRGDYKAALSAWRPAADQGDPDALYGLALLYRDGNQVPSDSKKAFEYLLQAAQGGHLKAQVALGLMYETGRGVSRSAEAAANWQRAAALQGHLRSQLRMAERYMDGDGVTADPIESYVWLGVLDTEKGSSSMEERPDLWELARATLSQEQLDLARQRSTKRRMEIAANDRDSMAKASIGRRASSPASRITASGGTGFLVDANNHLLTSYHVVRNCRTIRTGGPGTGTATLLAHDANLDLALLRSSNARGDPAPFAAGPLRLAESILTFGFPLPGILASSGNVGVGIVNALAGLGDDRDYFQISAPIQKGSSGAPVFNQYGQVVGIVVHLLDAVGLADTQGAVPQNIAFAIKLEPIRRFLERNGIDYKKGKNRLAITNPRIAEQAQKSTLQIQCFN